MIVNAKDIFFFSNMPPKRLKTSDACGSKSLCVTLGPLQLDQPQRFNVVPPIASLYNKSDTSDITVKVNDRCFFAHRLVLSAASDVFAKMFISNSGWLGSVDKELVLKEEDDCCKVFDDFLYYMYSGSIVIYDQHAIPLFVLSDKYNVKPLYNECVKVIEKGLVVYTVDKPNKVEHIEKEESPNRSLNECKENDLHYVGSETFPISLVIKILTFCHNSVICAAARSNLQARLRNQINFNNHIIWNDLPQGLLLEMINDDHFCCNEYTLFKAAKSWLNYESQRKNEDTVGEVLSKIRYATMNTEDLYAIYSDELINDYSHLLELVNEAIRYKLFANLPSTGDSVWSGKYYQCRTQRVSTS